MGIPFETSFIRYIKYETVLERSAFSLDELPTLNDCFSRMVSLRQLVVLNCSLEGSLSLNQDGTRPHRMGIITCSDESAPYQRKKVQIQHLICGVNLQSQHSKG